METYDLKFLNDSLYIGRDLGGETLAVTKNSALKGIKGTKTPQFINDSEIQVKLRGG